MRNAYLLLSFFVFIQSDIGSAVECRLATPSAASIYRLKGSCEQQKFCVENVICKNDDQKEITNSVVCLADPSSKCPSPDDCVKSEAFESEVAELLRKPLKITPIREAPRSIIRGD